MTTPDYDVAWVRIPEQVVEGKRLGRHVKHDSRSRMYAFGHHRPHKPVKPVLLDRHIPILDQGNVGSCTGNAEVGALGTTPLWQALSADQQATLTETLAVRIYSNAEDIDGDGPFPPNDNGSVGLSVCQAAKALGYISGYTHCFGVNDVLNAVAAGHAVILGTNWYSSMDSPDSSGMVTVSPDAEVRGGHEYLCRGLDPKDRTVRLDNSWGEGWGDSGSFCYTWDTLDRLLHEQGDGTVSVPLNQPAPTPAAP